MRLRAALAIVVALTAATASAAPVERSQLRVREYPVASGTHPHDVAPARDGGVWYTAQHTGELGWLNEDGPHSPDSARVRVGST